MRPASRGQHQRFTTVRVLESCCEMHKSNVAHTHIYDGEEHPIYNKQLEISPARGCIACYFGPAVKAMKIEREHWICIRLIGLCQCPSQRWLISECLLLLIITSHMAIIAITLQFLLRSGAKTELAPRTCSQNSQQKCMQAQQWMTSGLCLGAATAVIQLPHSRLRSIVLVARPDRVRPRTELTLLRSVWVTFCVAYTFRHCWHYSLYCCAFVPLGLRSNVQLSHRSGLHPQIASEMAKLRKHIRATMDIGRTNPFGTKHKRAHVVRPKTLRTQHFRRLVAIPRRENAAEKRKNRAVMLMTHANLVCVRPSVMCQRLLDIMNHSFPPEKTVQ